MPQFILTLGYLVAAGEFWLALYFWRTNSGNQTRKAMALLSLSTALWALATNVAMYGNPSSLRDLAMRLTYVFGVLMISSVLLFVWNYPLPRFAIDRWHLFFLFVPVGIFTLLMFGSKVIIDDYVASPTFQGQWIGGQLYNLYNGYLLLLFIISLFMLIASVSKNDGQVKKNIQLVTFSLLVGGAPGVINDLIVPFFTNSAKNPAIGTLSTVFWLGITSYIVLKK